MYDFLKLRTSRLEAGLDVSEVAASAGITAATLYRIEAGKAKQMRPSTVRKIASAMGREAKDFMVDDKEG